MFNIQCPVTCCGVHFVIFHCLCKYRKLHKTPKNVFWNCKNPKKISACKILCLNLWSQIVGVWTYCLWQQFLCSIYVFVIWGSHAALFKVVDCHPGQTELDLHWVISSITKGICLKLCHFFHTESALQVDTYESCMSLKVSFYVFVLYQKNKIHLSKSISPAKVRK